MRMLAIALCAMMMVAIAFGLAEPTPKKMMAAPFLAALYVMIFLMGKN